jgi:protease I
MAQNLKGVRVAILATDGFEQSELLEPRRALDEAGARTEVVSLKSGEIKGWNHKEWGETVAIDKTVDSVDAQNYDALLLPGGVMNPDSLRMDAKAVAFVKAFFDAKKPVGAICHGPWMLVEAGAVKGRTLTSWPSLKTDIQNAGGRWVDQEAAVDGNLVTSRNPKDIPAFNREIAKLRQRSTPRNDGAQNETKSERADWATPAIAVSFRILQRGSNVAAITAK